MSHVSRQEIMRKWNQSFILLILWKMGVRNEAVGNTMVIGKKNGISKPNSKSS